MINVSQRVACALPRSNAGTTAESGVRDANNGNDRNQTAAPRAGGELAETLGLANIGISVA
ncbi:MAG: hypothetical protein KDA55_15645 [Planctomycetales bacterium]|nr:hypothetical protein [Planctomycetales bacterium]